MSPLSRNTRFAFALAALLFATLSPALGRNPSKRAIEKEFLATNAAKPGIVTTKSGLQYEVLQEGEGTEVPNWRSTVSVHLKGSLIDGTVFENTLHREKPVSTQIGKLIAGCREAIKLMNVGDKYRFYIPSKLGYGSSKQNGIPPYSVFIFEIELVEISR